MRLGVLRLVAFGKLVQLSRAVVVLGLVLVHSGRLRVVGGGGLAPSFLGERPRVALTLPSPLRALARADKQLLLFHSTYYCP